MTSRFNESDGRWSPDGRRLAYVSDEFGQPDVFVQPWPAGGRVRGLVRERTTKRPSGEGLAGPSR